MSERTKKPYQTVTSVYVSLIFSFYLLFFDKNGLAAISKAKAVCYETLTLGYIAAILVLLLVHGVRRRLRQAEIKADLKRMPAAVWLILAYLLFTVVSACLSDYDTVWRGGIRREGVLTISLYCVSFLLVSRFYRPARWHLYLFAAATTAFCAICVFQMLNINVFGLYPLGENFTPADYVDKFIGTIGNIDFTASFLCIAIPIFWCSILRLKDKQRFLLFLPLLLCLFVLWRISVAAGFVGILIGTLLSLVVVLPCGRTTRMILLISFAALLIAALIAVYFVRFKQTELREIHNILHGKIKDSYASGRVYIWRRTLRAVPEHLWFGAGPDTMSYAAFARQETAGGILKVFDAAHNEYLTILYHQGVFALLAYLGALGASFVQWIRQAKEHPVAAIAGAAAACYCIQAFFGISQLITSPFFWCVFAVLTNAANGKNAANSDGKN
ncbi:MAG: O-antigen ligase family protein [Oscillospiraceae bacterium]|nr:O-antigen ligase family protein [Oscillospiraceae bacterium]